MPGRNCTDERLIRRGFPGLPRNAAPTLSCAAIRLSADLQPVIHSPPMRALRFLPLVFVLGAEGFTMFAPYVVMLLTVAYVVRVFRPEPAAAPIANPA